MMVKNTKENRDIQKIVASMAIEEMFFDEDFLIKIHNTDGKKNALDDLLKETIKKHAR